LTSPTFFAIMPEFQRAASQQGPQPREKPVTCKAMKRSAKKLFPAVIAASTLLMTLLPFHKSILHAQAPQSSSSDKPPATAAPAATTSASPRSAKQQTPLAKSAGMVWVNTETGVYHKQGARWYGKTKKGKYMLEADAIKTGYKPAK
jgi:hypothetical protein